MHPAIAAGAAALAPGLVALIVVAAVWELVLKGFALWHAARGRQKAWFVALLILNTVGILPLIYLIWFRPKNAGVQNAPSDSSAPAQH